MGKSWTNATNVTLHHPGQTVWEIIWKHTAEKSQTSAASAISRPLRQAIWGSVWKYTVEKSKQNETRVSLHPLSKLMQSIVSDLVITKTFPSTFQNLLTGWHWEILWVGPVKNTLYVVTKKPKTKKTLYISWIIQINTGSDIFFFNPFSRSLSFILYYNFNDYTFSFSDI